VVPFHVRVAESDLRHFTPAPVTTVATTATKLLSLHQRGRDGVGDVVIAAAVFRVINLVSALTARFALQVGELAEHSLLIQEQDVPAQQARQELQVDFGAVQLRALVRDAMLLEA
jgi:hypothetical protein